jgi:hypothetical protein
MLISSLDARAEVAAEWSAVRLQQERMRIHLVAGIHMGGWVMTQVTDDVYALLLPFGFSVLEHALVCAREEGRFRSASGQLWPMMDSARDAIPWRDFDAVNSGRRARNALAHERTVPSSATTFQALDAIEKEFILWQVLNAPVHHNLRLQVG